MTQLRATAKADLQNRIVYVTMSGIFDEDAMRHICAAMKEETLKFRGQEHAYLADMRGMKPAHPSVAAILGESIGWARRNGVVFCAHVSDDTVQRLQALRVVRQAAVGDTITVDCSTLDEAKKTVLEVSDRLIRGAPRLSTEAVAANGARPR